jgi:hypothetical protein
MPTHINIGLYQPNLHVNDEEDMIPPLVYVDGEKIQILDDDEKVVVELMYEELRGIMAIMAAEQEKQHFYIRAQAKNN